MKNKKTLDSVFIFSVIMTIVIIVLYNFTYCHKDVTNNVEILYYYDENAQQNIAYDNGLEKALATTENNLVIRKTKEKIINPGVETKYVVGQFKDKAATMIYREDVNYINSFYSDHAVLPFAGIKHLYPHHEHYAASLLNAVKLQKEVSAFITDESDIGEVYSDFYEDETFQTKLLLEEGKVNFSSEVAFLLSKATENIVLAVSSANFTRFIYDLSVSNFNGNVYIADSYFAGDLSLPEAFLLRKFTLNYASGFNFNYEISGAPGAQEKHDLRAFYQGFATGKLILALEKEKTATFNDDVFNGEVRLANGPTVLTNFIY